MSQRQLGLWIAVGAGVGIIVGVIMDNIAIWMVFGSALGLVMGLVSDRLDGDR